MKQKSREKLFVAPKLAAHLQLLCYFIFTASVDSVNPKKPPFTRLITSIIFAPFTVNAIRQRKTDRRTDGQVCLPLSPPPFIYALCVCV